MASGQSGTRIGVPSERADASRTKLDGKQPSLMKGLKNGFLGANRMKDSGCCWRWQSRLNTAEPAITETMNEAEGKCHFYNIF